MSGRPVGTTGHKVQGPSQSAMWQGLAPACGGVYAGGKTLMANDAPKLPTPPAAKPPAGALPDEVEGIEMITPVDQDDVTGESPSEATGTGTGGASGGLNADADGIAGAQQANEEGTE